MSPCRVALFCRVALSTCHVIFWEYPKPGLDRALDSGPWTQDLPQPKKNYPEKITPKSPSLPPFKILYQKERGKRITFYGDIDIPPLPPQDKQSPQFFSKQKGNKKLCFLRLFMDQGLKEVEKMY